MYGYFKAPIGGRVLAGTLRLQNINIELVGFLMIFLSNNVVQSRSLRYKLLPLQGHAAVESYEINRDSPIYEYETCPKPSA